MRTLEEGRNPCSFLQCHRVGFVCAFYSALLLSSLSLSLKLYPIPSLFPQSSYVFIYYILSYYFCYYCLSCLLGYKCLKGKMLYMFSTYPRPKGVLE